MRILCGINFACLLFLITEPLQAQSSDIFSGSSDSQGSWHAPKVRAVEGPAKKSTPESRDENLLKGMSLTGSSESSQRGSSCRELKDTYISQPYINIYSVDSVSNEYYRVRGSFEGKCLTEGGYFENDRKATSVQVRTTTNFDRFEFDLRVRADMNPELRVYNINGERAVYPVQVFVQRGPQIYYPNQRPSQGYVAPPNRGVDPADPMLLGNRK